MKTFINERLGFKIDVPENWALPAFEATQTPFGETIDFGCEYFESFSLLVSRVVPEQSLEQTENEFRQVAQRSGYTSLIFGRLSFAGKEHIWARYYLGGGKWSKNYFIMMHGIAYTISAFCFYQNRLLEREQVWDTVVASFRLLRHISWTPHFSAESGEPKGGIPIQLGGASSEQTARPAVQKKPTGLKTYRNEKHGFEIDLPQAWRLPPKFHPAC